MAILNAQNAEAARRVNRTGSSSAITLNRFQGCTLAGLVEYFMSAEAACGTGKSAQWEGGDLAPEIGAPWRELQSVWASDRFAIPSGKGGGSRPLEFFRLHLQDMVLPDSLPFLALHEFERRLVGAAQEAGLPTGFSYGLASVIHELVENVFQHSDGERKEVFNGIAACHWSKNYLAFSVADLGLGLLDSLRLCQRWKHLQTAKEAVRAVREKHASRKGDLDEGEGFRTVLKNLASKSTAIRIRTGNIAACVVGNSHGEVDCKWAESPPLPGVQVSVVCAAGTIPLESEISIDSITRMGD